MKTVIANQPGGPSVMSLTDTEPLTPGPDDIVVDVHACGVNYIDTYQRSGTYSVDFPFTPGLEGAGTVSAVGRAVSSAAVGDRVAWAFTPRSYAEQVILNEHDLYAVPDDITLETAAAMMLQGLTAHFLSASTYPLAPGDTALVHAGAGGVGLLLTQLAVARGARVITTVSNDVKAEQSRAAGADAVIRYDTFSSIADELPAAVRDLTDGIGVNVVYDGVGAATFDGSLGSLAERGTLALFGGASGQVPPVDLQRLNHGGSLFVTRPSMVHHLRTAEERAWRANELFDAVRSGQLHVRIDGRYALADAPATHEALESRRTMGKTVLTVDGPNAR
ncbi:quinone oxidoreductase family protein [Demequina sediminicola]|uniref:quinone oxidoreductase family protein n=1 Tax=Demequina sediminicola TaxID=1095026 RepID=UPI0007841E66|nr:quinone oxidoreductase [Demequina sediminicola]